MKKTEESNKKLDDGFPLDVLPQKIAEFTKKVSDVAGVNYSFTGSQIFSIAGASIGKAICARGWGERICKPNIFLIQAAEPGYGKSEVYPLVAEIYRDICNKNMKDWEKGLATIRVNVSKWEHDKKVLLADKKMSQDQKQIQLEKIEQNLMKAEKAMIRPILYGRDVTSESLKEIMSKNEVHFSLSPDAKKTIQNTLGGYKKNGETDESIFNSGYSWESDDSSRAGGKWIECIKPCISVNWSVATGVFNKLISSGALTESGFISRCIILKHERHLNLLTDPDPVPLELSEFWKKLISYNIKRFVIPPFEGERKTNRIVFDREALLFMKNWENERRQHFFKHYFHIQNQSSRWCEHAWRIVLILHCLWNHKNENTNISLETCKKAVKVTDWLIERQKQIWDMTGETEKKTNADFAKECLQKLSKTDRWGNYKFSAGTVRDITRANQSGWKKLGISCSPALSTILDDLVLRGALVGVEKENSRVYMLNVPVEVTRFCKAYGLANPLEELIDFSDDEPDEKPVEKQQPLIVPEPIEIKTVQPYDDGGPQFSEDDFRLPNDGLWRDENGRIVEETV